MHGRVTWPINDTYVLPGLTFRLWLSELRLTSYKQAVQAVREPQASCTLDVKGSGYCRQHTRQSSLSTYNGSRRSVILQGTQPNGCSHLTRVVMLPFHEIRWLPALVYISDLNVTPFTRYTGYPRWYTSLTYKVT